MALSNTDVPLNKNLIFSDNKIITKIAVIGDSGVGKTSLIKRITSNSFTTDYNMTIGGDFSTLKLPLINGRYCTFIFSDVSGQERFKETRSIFYSSVDMVFAVCDITRKQTLTNLEKLWIPEFLTSIKNSNKPKIQIIGNKSDLLDYSVLKIDDLEQVAFRISIKFPQITITRPCLITSAKENHFEIKTTTRQQNSIVAKC